LKSPIRNISLLAVAVLLLLSWASAQTPQPTPFTADMQFTSKSGQDMSGKIYVSHEHMRMDMSSGPHGGAIIITNFAARTSDTLLPQQHMYMEFKADDAMNKRPGMAPSIKALDPSNPCANEQGATCKNLGVEQVDGRSCNHWQITDKNGRVSNVWIDQKLHFPIKTASEDTTWQLTNIKETTPSADLFQIPPGYQKMDLGGMMQGMRPPQQ
jgi:hypothetical protein